MEVSYPSQFRKCLVGRACLSALNQRGYTLILLQCSTAWSLAALSSKVDFFPVVVPQLLELSERDLFVFLLLNVYTHYGHNYYRLQVSLIWRRYLSWDTRERYGPSASDDSSVLNAQSVKFLSRVKNTSVLGKDSQHNTAFGEVSVESFSDLVCMLHSV